MLLKLLLGFEKMKKKNYVGTVQYSILCLIQFEFLCFVWTYSWCVIVSPCEMVTLRSWCENVRIIFSGSQLLV